jgi:short subunit dehydrogenase-like uncharacterized protein
MTGTILLYGANGYTGRLTADLAYKHGIDLVLAGRNEDAIDSMANSLGFASCAADLGEAGSLDRCVADMDVVLHMAGPFSATARPMAEACLRTGTHYLDITGEISVFEYLAGLNTKAKRAGVMLLPGVGFDVVPSDCLLLHVKNRLPRATHLALAIAGLSTPSQGTAKTALESIGTGTPVRRAGRIETFKKAPRRSFDFGQGPVECIGVGWGDVATGFHTTGVPNIDVYFEATPMVERLSKLGTIGTWVMRRSMVQWFLRNRIERSITGPSAEERKTSRVWLTAIATDDAGHSVQSHLETPEAYALTAEVALDIAIQAASGKARPGFFTPAGLLGADYILELDGAHREDA